MISIKHKLLFYIAIAASLYPNALQAKIKNTITKNFTKPIDSSYFLQINLTESDCKKALGESCIFRDKLFSAPYFHKTTITIFFNKTFATQFSNDKTSILQVKNNSYELITTKNNTISFDIKNGEVFNLKITKGNLNEEQNKISKCEISKNFYNFYNIYQKNNEIIENSWLYKDDYNFNGLNQIILFANKNEPSEIMATSLDENNENITIKNIHLCKTKNSNILNVRYLNNEECENNLDIEECFKYNDCEDFITIENCDISLFKEGF